MQGSYDRTRRVIRGERPDRIPLFDLILNDSVLQYFNGGEAIAVGDEHAGARALARAIDGSRTAPFSPREEEIQSGEDGRERRILRWTTWEEKQTYSSSDEYRKIKQKHLAEVAELADKPFNTAQDEGYLHQCEILTWFEEDFYYLLSPPHQNLMSVWSEVGLEPFSYYLYDCEDVIIEQLEWKTRYACRWIEGLPDEHKFDCAFVGDDIAFKSGPVVNVKWLRRHYFPRLKRICAALHAKDIKVMFHSDGNLNLIMDDLVEAGIDVLNPIEICAGMDLADLHRRYPKLVFAGGIDVSHLLPFGTPSQIRDTVIKAIEDTEGKILVGSSTEVFDIVPVANFLAMRQTTLEYSL